MKDLSSCSNYAQAVIRTVFRHKIVINVKEYQDCDGYDQYGPKLVSWTMCVYTKKDEIIWRYIFERDDNEKKYHYISHNPITPDLIPMTFNTQVI
jgi:hypothetical protein|uniref:Uncharacterized protein n=1 Tax=viral metagenome TaxID=1070528 RepID=A0A6C0BMY9_9ZZZZ